MKETLDRLYEAIKHGDAEHQQWLKDKINSFLETESKPMETKSLSNTSIADVKATTSDVVVYGNGDLFQLICKASSKSQGWMKSTKAMQVYVDGSAQDGRFRRSGSGKPTRMRRANNV